MKSMNFRRWMIVMTTAAPLGVFAAPVISYDQNVTSNFIAGSGIGNGGFTLVKDVDNELELGLRARERYPTPNNDTNVRAGSNVYDHAPGGFGAGGTLAAWNFDWSINVGGRSVNDLSYLIGIDYASGTETSYLTFDPIKDVNPNPLAGGLALWDHSFGDSATAQGAGSEASGNSLPVLLASYDSLKSNNSLVQNSWNLGFFDGPQPFNPDASGQFTIFLEAYLERNLVARTEIEVMVRGTTVNPIPEPGTLALASLALLGLAGLRRRFS